MAELTGTAAPVVLPASDLSPHTERWDVVVVGFGIAGGCAALEAARSGARVLLLERAAVHGGTSSMSGGHFYLGGGTAVQQATGHADSADAMYDYLVSVSLDPEHDKIRAYCDGSVEHFDWLEALGFEFERSFYTERSGGEVPGSRLRALMEQAQHKCYGNTLEPEGLDPMFWASKMHFFILIQLKTA